jgi:hypothetical protein
VEELQADTGFDMCGRLLFAKRRIAAGAIAICVFAGDEFAHIGWIALNRFAKKAIDQRPCVVDFERGQGYTGGTFTRPKFRGRGLMAYGYAERFKYLRANGFPSARAIVSTDNIASQKVHAKFAPRIVAKASYRSFLFWNSWKETKINQ